MGNRTEDLTHFSRSTPRDLTGPKGRKLRAKKYLDPLPSLLPFEAVRATTSCGPTGNYLEFHDHVRMGAHLTSQAENCILTFQQVKWASKEAAFVGLSRCHFMQQALLCSWVHPYGWWASDASFWAGLGETYSDRFGSLSPVHFDVGEQSKWLQLRNKINGIFKSISNGTH